MPSVAELCDAVIGVDTHADSHSLEIAHPTGVVIATTTVSNDPEGFAAAVAFIADHAPGSRLFAGVEGPRSYGVGLARALTAAGLVVVEVEQPSKKARRGKGKTDAIDAHHAVLTTLRMDPDKLPVPRADGDREALRILLGTRREMTYIRTATVNALRAVLLTGDDTDRQLAKGTFTKTRLTALTRRRPRTGETREQQVRRTEAARRARRILGLDADLADNKRELTTIIRDLAPQLLDQPGVGPVSAGQAIVSYSHPGRCRHDGAFAALGGVSPIPIASGKTDTVRLNRGGDRQLNRALHDIAKTRMRSDPRTRAYVERRRTEGLPDAKIRRILKRYIARELFRHLNTAMA
jgi:transposase